MTNLKLLATALLVAGLAATPLGTLAANGNGGRAVSAPPRASAIASLSVAEVATLVWMREEEKLARDMYITLNTYFPAKIFTNIAASEQKHFDAIGKKLDLYGVADPATDVVGVFTNPDLQALYDELLGLGMVSYVEALKVGVTIEETDIADLEAAIDGTSSVPLARTYQHLLTGSEHHLAAFTRSLAKAGVVLD
jgi:hypothetical protein